MHGFEPTERNARRIEARGRVDQRAIVVGTELILVFDINPPPETDKYCQITVLNKGKHWSVNSWSFWVEDIG